MTLRMLLIPVVFLASRAIADPDTLIGGTFGSWRQASTTDKWDTAEVIIYRAKVAGITPNNLISCMDEMARQDDQDLMQQPIPRVAAVCVGIVSNGVGISVKSATAERSPRPH